MTTIQPNGPLISQTTIQPKQIEAKPKEKSSIVTGAKVALGASLTALAAIGVYIVTKGRKGGNIGKQIESLAEQCRKYSARYDFETPQIGKKLEEISQLPKKEKLEALNQLNTTLDHAEAVRVYYRGYGLPKGMKTLPDDVRQAYEQKDVLKAGELFKQHLDKLPNTRPAVTKGATVEETIENTFGLDSKIKPHTYDLSQESPVIGVYRNCGGYKDAVIGQEGRYFTDSLTPVPDKKDITASISHAFSGDAGHGSMSELRSIGNNLENPDRKLVRFVMPDPERADTSIVITVLSPNNKYTPLQKDMIKLMESPEKIDKNVFDKLTTVSECIQDTMEGNLYKYLDYDVLLSAIQSMAK